MLALTQRTYPLQVSVKAMQGIIVSCPFQMQPREKSPPSLESEKGTRPICLGRLWHTPMVGTCVASHPDYIGKNIMLASAQLLGGLR
jgi:hypothetical protein